MDSKNQLFYFCICIVVGFFVGLVYEPFAFLRQVVGYNRKKRRLLGVILDVLFPVIVALTCIFVQFILRFPSFRVYMWIGYALGYIIYLKILRRILAFLQKLCYNLLAKVLRKAKNKEKTLQMGGREL